MLPVVQSTAGAVTGGGTTITEGTNRLYSIWCASARQMSVDNGGESLRERQLTYSRGLKEKIIINISLTSFWKWRRIVFTKKGAILPALANPPFNQDPVQGMRRVINYLPGSNQVNVSALIFDGQEGVDWNDIFTAKVDTKRVGLKYDRTINLNSPGGVGMTRTFNMWHPTNKNLLYNDDENGILTQNSVFSTDGPAGMGDLFVVDIIQRYSGTNSGELQFIPEATYYWHEK